MTKITIFTNRLDKFSNISSMDSKFDMLKMFHREFISLKSLEARMKENTNHKFVVLTMHQTSMTN